jgi:hypothetical protein
MFFEDGEDEGESKGRRVIKEGEISALLKPTHSCTQHQILREYKCIVLNYATP